MQLHRGRDKFMWSHTSQLLAAIINPNRDMKKHPGPVTPNEINPYAEEKSEPLTVPIEALRHLFVKGE